MSLRARLLITTVVLVAVGLIAANVVTYRFLSSFLLKRVDEQLVSAQPFAAQALSIEERFGGVVRPPSGLHLPPGTYAEFRDGSGESVASTFFGFQALPRPTLPSRLPGSGSPRGFGARVFTTTSAADGPEYRVLAAPVGPGGGTLIVAIPMVEVRSTLHRLVTIEAAVSGAVLLVTAGLALWLVRLGLRPLAGIGETAGAIAGGDLTRRVEPADDRTEVGRLGASLNSMLAQIEAAFEQRRASEERLRRFVADASHELRTPLTSIRGYAELFRRGAGSRPKDLAKSMQRIEETAARMGVLVDDLLLLARLDQGRPLEREPVDVSRIASDAVEAARVLQPDREITLDVDGLASVMGDEGRLRQVVDNLLDNVRIHTPEGTPAEVRVETRDDEVLLTVADEGPGVPEKIVGRVFERFYRGDPARSRETGGVGLGLSIVSAIVAAHGGTVGVRSPDEGGAAFEVRLPSPRAEGSGSPEPD